jgi:hypothetical protein
LCGNNDVRASLGRHGGVCDAAYDGLAVTPAFRALMATARRTYVCGDVPCTTLLRDAVVDITDTVQGLVCVVLLVAVAVPAAVAGLVRVATTRGGGGAGGGGGPLFDLPLTRWHVARGRPPPHNKED